MTTGKAPHPCFQAVVNRDESFLESHWETCRDIKTQDGTTLLMLASAKGDNDIITYLLRKGVDINETDLDQSTAINYAVVTNQLGAATFLVMSGADLESKRKDGLTALMTAVQIGTYPMVKTLTTTGQALNSSAEDGWTPLYFAIRRQDPQILIHLLRRGACKNVKDVENISPLDFAKEVKWAVGQKILKMAPSCGPKKKHSSK